MFLARRCAGLAEWQTRGTQNALPERACGFKSHIRHQYAPLMNAVALVLAVVEGLLLIGVGWLEAFGSRTDLFRRMFGVRPEHLPLLRVWLVNQGFYNIVFGLGFLVGVVVAVGADPGAGRLLIVVLAAAQVVLGIVLLVTEPRLWRGAAVQTLLPLAVALAAFL